MHVGMTESYSSLSHSSAAIGNETHMQVAIKNLHIPHSSLYEVDYGGQELEGP